MKSTFVAAMRGQIKGNEQALLTSGEIGVIITFFCLGKAGILLT
jgi:hypothetical protein